MTLVLASAERNAGNGSALARPCPCPCPCAVIGLVVRRDRLRVRTEHAGAQALAQRSPFLLVHHHELEVHLFHAGLAEGGVVDAIRQLVGAGPGGHGEGDFDGDPSAARLHRLDDPELP